MWVLRIRDFMDKYTTLRNRAIYEPENFQLLQFGLFLGQFGLFCLFWGNLVSFLAIWSLFGLFWAIWSVFGQISLFLGNSVSKQHMLKTTYTQNSICSKQHMLKATYAQNNICSNQYLLKITHVQNYINEKLLRTQNGK